MFCLAFDSLDGERVDLPDDRPARSAVAKDILAIGDRFQIGARGQDDFPRHVEQEGVAAGHCIEDGVESKVLAKCGFVRGKGRFWVEISVRMKEEGFHGLIRAINES